MEGAMVFKEVKKHLEPDRTKDNAIQDSTLYSLVEKLVGQYIPSQKNEYDTRWFDFYLPTERKGKQICVPFAVVKLTKSMAREKDEYFLDFHGEDNGFFSIATGGGKADEAYYRIVQSTMDSSSLTNRSKLEKLVPYEFRTGKIKRKHIADENENLWSKERCKQVAREYSEHVRRMPKAGPVSLNEYLRVAAVGYIAAFPDEKNLPPLKLYESHADFRHGGMLDIKDPNSAKEFNKWLKSGEWQGSHPFEIVFSWQNYGIELWPPHALYSDNKTFTIIVGNNHYSEMYIAMLRAMAKEKAPVAAREPPMLSEALKFLSGESYFTVNHFSKHELYYDDTKKEREQYFQHIEWDALKVLKRA